MRDRVAFRVDSSIRMGSGHLMRCLALASALRDEGVESVFVLRPHEGHGADLVREHGHQLRLLAPAMSATCGGRVLRQAEEEESPLGTDRLSDARETALAIADDEPDCIVVDHYGIDAAWERSISSFLGVNVVAIDGLGERSHACSLLVDPTYTELNPGRWNDLVPHHAQVLWGPRYALVDTAFARALDSRPTRSGKVERVLIAFGGTDQPGMTQLALEAVLAAGRGRLEIDVVAGRTNPTVRELRQQCEVHPGVTFHHDTSQMAELMARADLALGAGGSMMWERVFLGLPAVLLTIAEHQQKLTTEVARTGAVIDAGPARTATAAELRALIDPLLRHPDRVRWMSERARELVGHDSEPGSVKVARQVRQLLTLGVPGR